MNMYLNNSNKHLVISTKEISGRCGAFKHVVKDLSSVEMTERRSKAFSHPEFISGSVASVGVLTNRNLDLKPICARCRNEFGMTKHRSKAFSHPEFISGSKDIFKYAENTSS